jgi:hypothetical protein
MTFNWAATEGSALSDLEADQVEFVKDIVDRIKGKRKPRPHFIVDLALRGSQESLTPSSSFHPKDTS